MDKIPEQVVPAWSGGVEAGKAKAALCDFPAVPPDTGGYAKCRVQRALGKWAIQDSNL